MNVCLVTPAPPRSRKGNRITAIRWAGMLRDLGHRVRIYQEYTGQSCDLMVAMHARRSATSVRRFARQRPDSPLILALTGTDLYGDLSTSTAAQRSVDIATRLIVLQSAAINELPNHLRSRTRVIYQSVAPLRKPHRHRRRVFDVCVIGHLRPVKDPFRAAMAARLLPKSSRTLVTHVGAALTSRMQQRAEAETRSNPRYEWIGEVPRWRARRILARSRLLVLTSRAEGGANVLSEAIADSIPVIASRISGSVGILGRDYPGYFTVGNTRALADLLRRAETDPTFYRTLNRHCQRLTHLVDPARERQCWASLLRELTPELVLPTR